MTAAEAIRRLQKVNIEEVVLSGIEETADDFIKLNEEQWQEGKTNTGETIVPYPYSAGYARTRKREGLQTDHIDLYRKGNLYKGYSINVEDNAVKMQSDVSYEKYVSKRYQNIWGLNPESLKIYVPGPLQEAVREKFTEETGCQYK